MALFDLDDKPLIYVEPDENDNPIWMVRKKQDAAEAYRRAFPERVYSYENALHDFIVTHWATEVDSLTAQHLGIADGN